MTLDLVGPVRTLLDEGVDHPSIDGMPGGGFVLAWIESRQIYVTIFDAYGGEVNQFPLGQAGTNPSVVVLSDGSIVTAWVDYDGIKAMRVNSDGQTLSDAAFLQSDNASSESNYFPNLLALADGGFAATYRGTGRDGSRGSVHLQIFDVNLTSRGADQLVNQTTEGHQNSGRTVALDDGGIAVAFSSRNVDGSVSAAMMRIFDADGTPRTDQIRLNQYSSGQQHQIAIVALNNDLILATWTSDGQDGSDDGIYARLFDTQGRAQGNEFRVNFETLGDQNGSDLIALADGSAVVSWLSGGTDGELRARHIDAQGVPSGAEIIIGADERIFYYPQIVQTQGNGAVVVWPDFTDRSVGTTEAQFLAFKPIATAENDMLFGTAQDDDFGGGAGNDVLQGYSDNDRLFGDTGADTITGGNGADTLIGGDGDDFIFGGGDGADLRDVVYGGNGNDQIDGGYGNDELRGQSGDDTISGGFGADTILGGSGNDILAGSAYADRLFGNEGDDFLNGGFGSDRLRGQDGADRFFHAGVTGHGTDWIADFSHAEGDRLVFGLSADASNFQIRLAHTPGVGSASVEEAFVVHTPSRQIIWVLVDGADEAAIQLQSGGQAFDLLG
ncbi:hemolysin type calcium-binding protein [Primorskyibacter sedentarius]|uniref:Hemolysin type calcium-binding protein n=1 Tax=Primorskyibacter sedentarius TaxID=745311 RepID=A0A4R3J6F5_9RHOB|nr:calcium-binding protein [Primorskyibacter sedentarius]TCS60030.1 hemolysin type calcium-binding protein [Primorskyibacter sedentarius]